MAQKANKKASRVARPPKLASLPSAALVQAIGDLEKVERDAKKVVVMSTWVELIDESVLQSNAAIAQGMKKQHKPKAQCAVCFAGAVMMNVPQPARDLTTASFAAPLESRLDALDEFRQGLVTSGLRAWGYDAAFADQYGPGNVHIPDYATNAAGFKRAVLKLAKGLAAKGF